MFHITHSQTHPNDGNTYDIISKMAYLTGVPQYIFEKEYTSPQLSIFEALSKDKNCKIVRSLCTLRKQIVCHYKSIGDAMRSGLCSIYSVPQYVDTTILQDLSSAGIRFSKEESRNQNMCVIAINRMLSDRINNCRPQFPTWLNWQYIRGIFVGPDWFTEAGVKAAAKAYYACRSQLPYQVFIHWTPIAEEGNLYANDMKFIRRLYEVSNDYFADWSKVYDYAGLAKIDVKNFLANCMKAVLIVDCENSDPYMLCAAIKGLTGSGLSKIRKVILIDDVNTTPGWESLALHIPIPVDHVVVRRIKEKKSLVDAALIARACQEHYQNQVDAFLVASSDSDFWALVEGLPMAQFLFMVQKDRFSCDMQSALTNREIPFCYLDDFYADNAEIQNDALLRELARTLESTLRLDLKALLQSALTKTRVLLNDKERDAFFQKHIKTIRLVIEEDQAHLALNIK